MLNLEELFNISQSLGANVEVGPVEVVVDSQIFAEVGKDLGKEFPAITNFPKEEGGIYQNLSNENTRAVLAVKLIQLLKLKRDG